MLQIGGSFAFGGDQLFQLLSVLVLEFVGFGPERGSDYAVSCRYAVRLFTDVNLHDRGETVIIGLNIGVIPAQ